MYFILLHNCLLNTIGPLRYILDIPRTFRYCQLFHLIKIEKDVIFYKLEKMLFKYNYLNDFNYSRI